MFEIVNNRQIIFGEGKIKEISKILNWYHCKNVFLVIYDKNSPIFNTIKKVFEDSNINYTVYDKIIGEPDLHSINNGRDLFLENNCDCTIAIGGGSVIDAAKAINMLTANGGNVEDYQMNGKEVTKLSPLFIALPTTSGTGAEATKVSVVTNNYNGLKKSLYHTTMIADIVILDPTLTLELPQHITAATGMDALSHAIESYVSLNANPLSEMYSLKAIELINKYLVKAYNEPHNIEARGGMMLASYLGGCAITAGIGIAHIMAQPLGAIYHIPHGDACSIFLPISMELNLEYCLNKYAKIAETLGVNSSFDIKEKTLQGIEKIKEIRKAINAPETLSNYIKETPDMNFIIDTIKKTTGHITCNPSPLNEELMLAAWNKAL